MAAEPQLRPVLVVPDGGTSLADSLDLFAAGRAVPGSGSANALTAAFAAALVASVASKTAEHADMPHYRPISDTAAKIMRRGKAISDELLVLLTEDAQAFGQVIAWRREAKTLREQYDQDQARLKEIAATKHATEIPLKIAVLSLEISDHAFTMLEQGYKTARGESYSAVLAALAAAESAVYVARLNIKNVTVKITTLNDPQYEQPWLELQERRADELNARVTSYRERLDAIRIRESSEFRKARRNKKRSRLNS